MMIPFTRNYYKRYWNKIYYTLSYKQDATRFNTKSLAIERASNIMDKTEIIKVD